MFADWLLDLRTPTGEVLEISKDATFQRGRIRSLNEVKFVFIFIEGNINKFKTQVFPHHGCSIEITNLDKVDGGEWR